jgi:hypothetical protein
MRTAAADIRDTLEALREHDTSIETDRLWGLPAAQTADADPASRQVD